MAERKAANKYYPPDWTPSQGNLNKYHGESWRTTAATVNGRASAARGVNIIRMEMPYNVWCEGCKNHIGKGVRYNAEKRQVGTYFSTKIWSFRMKCHLCDNWMELRTDPKNRDYACHEGVQRKTEDYSAKDAGTIELMSKDEREKIESDPFFKLEHTKGDVAKAKSTGDRLQQIHSIANVMYKDDYANSRALRKQFRADQKGDRRDRHDLKSRHIPMPLPLRNTEEDVVISKAVEYGTVIPAVTSQKRYRQSIGDSIFAPRAATHKTGPLGMPVRVVNRKLVGSGLVAHSKKGFGSGSASGGGGRLKLGAMFNKEGGSVVVAKRRRTEGVGSSSTTDSSSTAPQVSPE